MKGLFGMLILVCLERRALARKTASFVWEKRKITILFHAEDCNDIYCNPGCFVPQLLNLTLAISQETNDGTCLNLINSTGFTSWSVKQKTSFTTISQHDGLIINCGIMDSTCNIPSNIISYSCGDNSVVKFECNLERISPTNCATVL